MKKIIKFSKKISDISSIKKDFFSDNKVYLDRAKRGFRLYVKEKRNLKRRAYLTNLYPYLCYLKELV